VDYESIVKCIASHPNLRLSEIKLPGIEDAIEKRAAPSASAGNATNSPSPARTGEGISHVHIDGNKSPAAQPTAARNALELRLSKIWETVLEVAPIGVTQNFFDLGGHSLLAVRLLAAIEKEWSRRLPLRVVFHAPTIEKMAAVMAEDGWKSPVVCTHADSTRRVASAAVLRHRSGWRHPLLLFTFKLFGRRSAGFMPSIPWTSTW